MFQRRRPALALSLLILAFALMPGMSQAAGRRSPVRLSAGESAAAFVADLAIRAWEALTRPAPAPLSHLSDASGVGIDPLGCNPAPCTNGITPPDPDDH